jgi:cob(I)alamin adenosyltransferase
MTDKLSRGLIQVYTGDGKGKTSAALGLAMRASGDGLKVIFIQFVKGIPTGEHIFVEKYKPFEIIQPGVGDCFSKTREQLAADARKTLEFARRQLSDKKYDVVILDEIFVAVDQDFITKQEFIELIDLKPERTELILTGRNAPLEVVQRADLVTEMLMIKHPFNKGTESRPGEEF